MNKYGYEFYINRTDSSQTLAVRFYFNDYGIYRKLFVVEYLRTKGSTNWYATYGDMVDVRFADKISKIFGKLSDCMANDPIAMISQLSAMRGWKQVVYDGRVGVIPVEDVKPDNYIEYMDVPANGREYPTVSVTAENVTDAQRRIMQKLADEGYTGVLQDWLNEGMLVRRSNNTHNMPRIFSIDDLS